MARAILEATGLASGTRGPQTSRGATAIDRHIGSRVARTRAFRSLSLAEFAEILGISEADVAAREQGVARIEAALLIKMARVLDVKPSFLFRGAPRGLVEATPTASIDPAGQIGLAAEEESLPSKAPLGSMNCPTTRKMLDDLMLVAAASETVGQRWLM